MIFGKHINRYYWKYAPLLLLGVATLIAVDYLQLLIPNLYQMVINGLNQGYVEVDGAELFFDMDFLLDRICMPMAIIIICIVIGRFLWRVCLMGASTEVETDIRNEMFHHAEKLSQDYFHHNNVGKLMSLFTNDLETVRECYGWGVLMFFDALFLGGMAIWKMWKMDPVLTMLSMIPMALLLTMATLVGKSLTKKWDTVQERYSDLSDFSQERFSGMAVVKAFVKEAKELASFRVINKENDDANLAYHKTHVLMRICITLFVESVICVILGYGGYLVYKDTFNAGQLMEFIGYFNSVIWPVMAVSDLIDMTSRGKASLRRISELLNAQPDMLDKPGARDAENIRGDITFRNLTFRYPDGEYNALEDVSFTIKAGENVGLVGKTGSGKTTLVDLILRTYNVPDGTVFIDGTDVNDLTIHSVRAGCAYVPQDNFLFSDTIANNISFGSDEKSMSAVVKAAVQSDVDSNIRDFQLGYETVLGERGVTVSGGQKQRISIARALMKNAPVLILDDSVSAVDTKTEQSILQNLHDTRAGKTTIFIAHRISTVEKMDKILFIDEGKVVAVGTHEELMATCPEYDKMVQLQRLEEEGEVHHE